MTSQIFCYYCVEYNKLDIRAKFHDHRSNNNKVMMGSLMPPPPMTDGSKKPMSARVNPKSTVLFLPVQHWWVFSTPPPSVRLDSDIPES